MINFYKFMQILENNKSQKLIENIYYSNLEEEWVGEEIILGEDDYEPFSTVVGFKGADWEIQKSYPNSLGVLVRNYKLNGKELPASNPKQINNDVDFTNAGKDLENMHEPLKTEISNWIEKEIKEIKDRAADMNYRKGYHYGDFPQWNQ